MKYEVRPTPDSAPIVVEVGALDGKAIPVTIGGRTLEADVVRAGAHYSILVDGHVVDPVRARLKPAVVSERAGAGAGRGGAGRVEKVVKSPMPGRIVKINVSPGDVVEVGSPLLVVEAMKMENEVRAKAPGTVGQVHVAVGQAVEANSKLVSFQ